MTKLFYVLSFCSLFFGLCVIAFSFWFPNMQIGGGFNALFTSLLYYVIGNLWDRVKDLEKKVDDLKNAQKDENNL